jgi:ubiquinone/menaquinone biosynthesis C-methylase UbiE
MIKEARKKYPGKEFVVADAHYLPFKDKSFDVCMSCLAFLWYDDQEKVLKEMVRVARKVYVVEEEGIPARKRIEIPSSLQRFRTGLATSWARWI